MNAVEQNRRSTDPVPVPDFVRDLTEEFGHQAMLLWRLMDREYRSLPDQRGFEVTLPAGLE